MYLRRKEIEESFDADILAAATCGMGCQIRSRP